ncbi:aldehyde oxidoreductase molybdenum-binding subunit PaoC [Hansschlegelia quercus]|uniref:Xanthine dehydrogenase family protein molybdopterin-binding subunit n=1 Tax=Hansschlegelia quercus TaxID=2528245 RepID=A0A4Q9GKW6_9HYPH|nr:aldehyde oxidoreductase molybdenum-binding subunit PaoC [Hansschlegelia quercus]TBN54001.1 xanthine dehydrogenase family protein molybdopterin-binding subunit [Hansschlegelia quercus]
MKFNEPAGANPIDRQKVIGKPFDRIEGPLKVTGRAPYAYERHDAVENPAVGFVVGAGIAKGRIKSIDVTAARKAPGVLAVVTAETAGKLGLGKYNIAKLLGGPEIDHYHQAIAVVVAESFEQARAAAGLLRVDYAAEKGVFDLRGTKDTSVKPKPSGGDEPDSAKGDFAGAFEAAAVKLDETYTTPDHAHAMMEPHASMASWDGNKVTVWTSNQMIDWGVSDLAKTLGLPKENVRLVSPYVGGGFGGKLFLRADAVLAALGAKAAGRPVKVALPRPLVFNNTTHRPATVQRVRIGAGRDGKITAIGHETWSGNLPNGKPENAIDQTRLLYAGANRMTATRLALLNLPEGNAMRAPGEAPGLMALEIAMDEMAGKLGMDPVEFRILNDTQVDPENPERKFSQRRLSECFRIGSGRFGWSARKQPGETRDGRWLVGMGVATAFRGNLVMKSAARARLAADGRITVETDMTDIGTGTYTIIAQTTAEMLGVPLTQIDVKLGDSAFPVSAGSGGQWGANSATSGVYACCVKLREAIARQAGLDPLKADFADGQVTADGKSVALAGVANARDIVVEDGIEFGDLDKRYAQSTFGAHFVEIGVDHATGESRIRRMLAVCAAGRILNPKSARSQVIGAMTMGAGAALMEELAVDKERGFFVNHDLAGYEVPVHADIPHQEVVFLDETDPYSSPMKAKGVGELGICGVAAAVANAIYNATGVRVRDYPITLDKLLSAMPEVG